MVQAFDTYRVLSSGAKLGAELSDSSSCCPKAALGYRLDKLEWFTLNEICVLEQSWSSPQSTTPEFWSQGY